LNEAIEPKDIVFPDVKIEISLTGIQEDFDKLAVIADWVTNNSFSEARLTYLYYCRSLDKVNWVKETRKKLNNLSKKENETDLEFFERKKLIVELPIEYYFYTIFGGGDITRSVDGYFLRMLKYEYLDGLRDAERELATNNKFKLLYKVLSSQKLDSLDDFKSEIKVLQNKLASEKSLNTVKDNISKYLDEFTPEFTNDNKIEFQFSELEIQEMLKHLSLHFGENNTSIEFNGLGYNNLLFISLVLSYLDVSKDDHTVFRVISIEEPEAHLHPHLQKHLSSSIKSEFNDGTQLILSTHSTHISSKLDLESTAILFHSEDEVKYHYILDGIKPNALGRKKERFLRKYLDATNSEMFYSRKLILVEGISEMLVIPELYRRAENISLEKAGCSIVNVNGLAFKNFLDIVKNGYFIKCVVLTDSDVGTKAENRAENLQKEYKEFSEVISVNVTKESTFEKDLIFYNKTGMGRYILYSALKKTRPQKWKEVYLADKSKEIDVDSFFSLIETYSEKVENGKTITTKGQSYKSEG
jgi:putative ATP-dependent endonuclease of OLD family